MVWVQQTSEARQRLPLIFVQSRKAREANWRRADGSELCGGQWAFGGVSGIFQKMLQIRCPRNRGVRSRNAESEA